jgi:hypothetical protein
MQNGSRRAGLGCSRLGEVGQDQPKHRCSFREWSEHSQSGHAGGDPASLRSRRYRIHRKRRHRPAEEVKAGLVRSRRIWLPSSGGGGLLRESRCNLRRESLPMRCNPPAACCRPRGRLSGSSSGLMLFKGPPKFAPSSTSTASTSITGLLRERRISGSISPPWPALSCPQLIQLFVSTTTPRAYQAAPIQRAKTPACIFAGTRNLAKCEPAFWQLSC